MRIISGFLRGKKLATPQGLNTRPTSDKARQGVFNILEHAPWSPGLRGLRILDIFAGSGAMGLEAMSRGADFALFIDNDANAISVIKSNIDACGFDKNQTIANKQNALILGPNPLEKYDLAFLDAPYDTGLNEETMPILLANGWLKSGAIVVSENRKGQIASALDGFELLREVNYGMNGFAFYTVKPAKFRD